MAPTISVKVILSVDDFHCIVPVLPLSVNVVLFVPVQTVVAPPIVPATLVGLTVMVDTDEISLLQTPLVTTA